ncbi:MAG: diaminopimelate epimerase [Bacteroidia bacterium]|nr:diaminopimelate epimerase [Bacteroidia bacterium]
MKFYKYQGTGNDFIIIDNRKGEFHLDNKSAIEQLCHRRFGIGSDGLILLQLDDTGAYYMKYYNSDGAESSMCGNGGRCFAQFIFDLGLAEQEVEFLAIDGKHRAHKMVSNEGESWIALEMIPVKEVKKITEEVFELNTGSPHYVAFVNQPVSELELITKAKAIRYNEPYTQQGINVNYVNMLGLKDLCMRTYERGVEDETFSCGTGATAAALSAALFADLPAGKHSTQIEVPGGKLAIQFFISADKKSFSDIWLMGPAKQVFIGEF